MKKFLFLLLFSLFAYMTQAQIYTLRSGLGNTSDTVTNTGTEELTARVPGDGSAVTVQLTVTKLTGTVAGSASLYGTVDGVSYGKISADTLAIGNVDSQTKIWVVSGHPCTSYKVVVTGSGTSTYTISGSVLRRK